MGGTHSQELLQIAKEIWDYLLANWIAVTTEYLPSNLNIQADWQSGNHRVSSDWKLNPKIFSQIEKIRAIPQIDRFASWLNHPKIHVMAPGPRQLCSSFTSVLLGKPLLVCTPSILLNTKDTCQSKEEPVSCSYQNTSMANSAMVHSINLNVGSTSHNST